MQESKRIADVPLDFELVVELFKQRFPVLDLLLTQVERPQQMKIHSHSHEIRSSSDLSKQKRLAVKNRKVLILEASIHDVEPEL